MGQIERLQKILSRSGYGSRRACEELIRTGHVTVNGEIALIGCKADTEKDIIKVDGKTVNKSNKFVYVAIHKPRGYLSTPAQDGQSKSVYELVNINTRLFTVGRLDKESEGLLLLTNDGDLTNLLTHPRYQHEKEYKVHILRKVDEERIEIWRRGVVLEDGYRTKPATVSVLNQDNKGTWLKIVMREGKKRQIRKIGERIGLPVDRIIRTRIGNITLGKLKPGDWKYISIEEIKRISKY